MARFNDYRASTIAEPLIQRRGGDLDSKNVENGEAIFRANSESTAKPQEPSVELFADTVKDNQSDAKSINGINSLLYVLTSLSNSVRDTSFTISKNSAIQ